MRDWFKRVILRKKVRGFEVVADWARLVPDVAIPLPVRATDKSAGYDIFALEDKVVQPGEKVAFATDVKVYMQDDEVFHLYPRSSQGIKFDVMLANTTGVIDADYYGNPTNDGSFTIVIRNMSTEPYVVRYGDRIAQGEFAKYLKADSDYNKTLGNRTGGTGSTGK